MPLSKPAERAIQTAERSLKALLEEAIRAGHYDEVVQLAEAARVLASLVSKGQVELTCASDIAGTQNGGEPVIQPPRRARRSAYPRFEILGDRLVKTGWSKRAKAEYQHKATREGALHTFRALATSADRPFRMDDFLPVQLEDGSELPTYQSYLVLAWLRDLGYIVKKGKDTYQWTDVEPDDSAFSMAWERTHT
ncbi:hypothetical protein [Luteimonas vadosa]|uniref:Uncharacterized protein n=1 Tax=Luteimonas vadosa TaxID=1165507 RepID=A0ABP9DT44_9GAMM